MEIEDRAIPAAIGKPFNSGYWTPPLHPKFEYRSWVYTMHYIENIYNFCCYHFPHIDPEYDIQYYTTTI